MAIVNAKSLSPDMEEDSENIDSGSGRSAMEDSAIGTVVAWFAATAVAPLAITGSENGNCVCAAFGDTLRRLTR